MDTYHVIYFAVMVLILGWCLGAYFEGKWWKAQFDRVKELDEPTETNRLSVGSVDALNKHLENCNWRN